MFFFVFFWSDHKFFSPPSDNTNISFQYKLTYTFFLLSPLFSPPHTLSSLSYTNFPSTQHFPPPPYTNFPTHSLFFLPLLFSPPSSSCLRAWWGTVVGTGRRRMRRGREERNQRLVPTVPYLPLCLMSLRKAYSVSPATTIGSKCIVMYFAVLFMYLLYFILILVSRSLFQCVCQVCVCVCMYVCMIYFYFYFIFSFLIVVCICVCVCM